MSLAFAVPTFAPWHDDVWDTILDLSVLLDSEPWALVGGQAIVSHALAHDTDESCMPRTLDAIGRDAIGHIVTTSSDLDSVRLAFRDLGFSPDDVAAPIAGAHRVLRQPDTSALDDRPQSWVIHVAGSGPSLSAYGDGQALARREPYEVTKGLRAPWVPVPDLLASIVYEAAQFCSDTAEPFGHARDAAFLVSLMRDPVAERDRLQPDDLHILRSLDAAVGQRSHHVWSRLPFDRDAFTTWRLLLAR